MGLNMQNVALVMDKSKNVYARQYNALFVGLFYIQCLFV